MEPVGRAWPRYLGVWVVRAPNDLERLARRIEEAAAEGGEVEAVILNPGAQPGLVHVVRVSRAGDKWQVDDVIHGTALGVAVAPGELARDELVTVLGGERVKIDLEALGAGDGEADYIARASAMTRRPGSLVAALAGSPRLAARLRLWVEGAARAPRTRVEA